MSDDLPEKPGSLLYSKLAEKTSGEQEASLRPPDFSEFCGQEEVKERLMLMGAAAKKRATS